MFEVRTILRLILLCGIPLLGHGCGKKTESPSPAASAVSTAPGVPPAATDMEAVLGELTQALRKYSVEHRQSPKNLDEVVGAGYVKQMPEAPPGKKFEVDPKTMKVVLVKR